jgi:hypothetical protein
LAAFDTPDTRPAALLAGFFAWEAFDERVLRFLAMSITKCWAGTRYKHGTAGRRNPGLAADLSG